MLDGLEKALVAMEVLAIIGGITLISGVGYGIFKFIMWLIK